MTNLLASPGVIPVEMFTTTHEGTATMFSIKRIVTLAAITAAAIVPAVGAQAATAHEPPGPPTRDMLVNPCVPKWILPPAHPDDGEEGSTFDNVEHQSTGTEHDPSGMGTIQHDTSGGSFETVEHDDFSNSGC